MSMLTGALMLFTGIWTYVLLPNVVLRVNEEVEKQLTMHTEHVHAREYLLLSEKISDLRQSLEGRLDRMEERLRRIEGK